VDRFGFIVFVVVHRKFGLGTSFPALKKSPGDGSTPLAVKNLIVAL
jgi:hypothetical protein